MQFFNDCKTEQEVKAKYRELAFKHHPDRGGDTATMQTLNDEYMEAMKRAKGLLNEEEKKKSSPFNKVTEQEFIEKISAVINLEGVIVEIIGTWVWLSGETKQHADKLNKRTGAGFSWHRKRKMWFWAPEEYRRGWSSDLETDGLRAKYGSTYVTSSNFKTLHAAS